MTPQQTDLVKQSFSKVVCYRLRLTKDFFTRYLAAYPELESVFPENLAQHRNMFDSALLFSAKNIDNPGVLEPVLSRLGAQHQALALSPEHFLVMGDTLEETLLHAVPGAFDNQEIAAWRAAFDRLSDRMIAHGAAA